MQDENIVAIHESGHAVAALLLGRAYGCRLVDSPGCGFRGLAGNGELDVPSVEPDVDAIRARFQNGDAGRAFDDAMIAASGVAAVALHRRETCLPLALRGYDAAQVEEACNRLFGERDMMTVRSFEGLAIRRAVRLLAPHMMQVECVARLLVLRRELIGDDVARQYRLSLTANATPGSGID